MNFEEGCFSFFSEKMWVYFIYEFLLSRIEYRNGNVQGLCVNWYTSFRRSEEDGQGGGMRGL